MDVCTYYPPNPIFIQSQIIFHMVFIEIKRICSTEEEFSKKSVEYINHLLARRYKRNKVKKQFQKANFFSRETLLTKQPKNIN